mgnify:CR=1 FL=1
MRSSIHIAGCEARLLVVIDGVQQRVLHQVFRRTVFQDAEVDGPSQPVSFDRGIEAKPMTPDWNGPLAVIGTSFSTGRSCGPCRSELARDGLKSAVFNQQTSVIVNDYREQARSYRGRIPLTDGHQACTCFFPLLTRWSSHVSRDG